MNDQKSDTQSEFTAKAAAKGWGAINDCPPAGFEVIPVWFYSHGYHTGGRLISQVQKDAYENGLSADVTASFEAIPGDAYLAIANEFDATPEECRGEIHQPMTARMIHYSRNSKLWKMLPHYTQTPGVHLILMDWHSVSNKQVVVQAAILQADLLTPQEVAELSKEVIGAHVARHPYDKPVSRRKH